MKIFWDYKRSLMGTLFNNLGLPLIIQMAPKILIPPSVIFGSIIVSQYLLTSADYYDEYDGNVAEYSRKS